MKFHLSTYFAGSCIHFATFIIQTNLFKQALNKFLRDRIIVNSVSRTNKIFPYKLNLITSSICGRGKSRLILSY